jgi:hypothetical protein
MAKAILEVFENREAFAARAATERAKFIAENTVDTYWRRCLDAENSA